MQNNVGVSCIWLGGALNAIFPRCPHILRGGKKAAQDVGSGFVVTEHIVVGFVICARYGGASYDRWGIYFFEILKKSVILGNE